MGDPGYEGIATPYKLSEWEAIVRDVRFHLNGNATRTETVATDLRRLIPIAKGVHGNAAMLGLDVKASAYRISRVLMQASAAETAAASAWSKADYMIHGLFAPGDKGPGSGRRFDFTA